MSQPFKALSPAYVRAFEVDYFAPLTTFLPVTPVNLMAVATAYNSITVSWDDPNVVLGVPVSGFILQRSTNGATWDDLATLGANVTSYVDGDVLSDSKYYYRVAAYSARGDSQFSNADDATTPVEPGIVLSTSAPDYKSAQLDWTDPIPPTSVYSIYRSTDNINFVFVASVGSSTYTYLDDNLPDGTTYYYKVSNTNDHGLPRYSNTSSVAVPAEPAISLGAADVDYQSIQLNWTDPIAPTSVYSIYRSTDNINFSLVTTVGSSTYAYLDTGLDPSTTYYYKVSNLNYLGNPRYSNVASATTAILPGVLDVSPAGGYSGSGSSSSVTPASKQYTVSNIGGVALNWTTSALPAWISLDITGGTLNPGQSVVITATIVPTGLSPTTYNYSLDFTNVTSGLGNTSRSFVLVIDLLFVDYLLVGGGGGGGALFASGGGGGGGGGKVFPGSATLDVTATHPVVVGAGGAGGTNVHPDGLPGDASTFNGDTAAGGDGGFDISTPDRGDGGTSGSGNSGGIGESVGSGGGGGGDSQTGFIGGVPVHCGGNGGNGTQSSISGAAKYYGGGGGGCGGHVLLSPPGVPGAGGLGGGGNGAYFYPAGPGGSGTNGFGGGGGGAKDNPGGSGGSGTVIVSYDGPQVFTGGTVTSAGGKTIHTFTSSGSLAPL